jgi:hypothetical protein
LHAVTPVTSAAASATLSTLTINLFMTILSTVYLDAALPGTSCTGAIICDAIEPLSN